MSDVNQLLKDLHNALAKELLERVTSGEAKPQDLAVAVKFLKDNNIDALLIRGGPLADLAKALGDDLFQGPDDAALN